MGVALQANYSLNEKIAAFSERKFTRIGNGSLRDVWSHTSSPDLVFKELRPKLSTGIPTAAYTFFRYGTTDINQRELAVYTAITNALPKSADYLFGTLYKVIPSSGRNLLLADTILNSDGTVAKTLEEHGPVRDELFWDELRELQDALFGADAAAYVRPKSIAVKETLHGKLPVLFDYKRVELKPTVIQCSNSRHAFRTLRDTYQR